MHSHLLVLKMSDFSSHSGLGWLVKVNSVELLEQDFLKIKS